VQRYLNQQTWGIFGIMLVLVGMLFSADAWMSIGMMVLAGNAVLNLSLSTVDGKGKRLPIYFLFFNYQIGKHFRVFVQNRALVGLTAIFFLVLISGLWSENVDWWVNRSRMKLPFLLLPFAVVAIPRFDKTVYYPILAGVFWVMVGICAYSIGLYVADFDRITEEYKQGHVLYTPVMHIRFSLLVAYSIVIGYWLFVEEFRFKFPAERWLMLTATAFLLVYIHILAVRSGLVSLYGALLYFVLYFIIKSKQYFLGIGLALLLVIGSAVAVRFVPTLWNKVGYMQWSLQQIQQGERLADLSDSYRLATIEAGFAIGNAHPVLGVGFGDIKQETKSYLQQKYPELLQQIYMPQSEYVLFYAATGLVGLLLFIFVTFQPLLYQNGGRHLLIGGFHVMMIISFVVEQTLETQLGTAIYVFFATLGIRHQMEIRKIS